MMTSSQIRQSFLDFFKSKQHTIVPSSSLLPDSPNLLFTNAGMNQFVPIFLGQTQCPYKPGRAADTQKCIRAGGKHNDLEDVGLDTYHHTFFEMLGNWSFGDYFKKEAIEWAWELVISKKWFGFPPERLYATVYKPGPGDPSEFDQEAYDHWAQLFTAAGLDPKVHICTGGKKDNFWMMGDTGPCGPCSELHVDLTPDGNTKGDLVNKGDARCIEIWNLVFIQYNANPDGTFSPLPAKHVDTGMGFERVTSIIQCTKGFKDFTKAKISNYETDIFRPIFDEVEKLSGKKYASTLPGEHTRLRVLPTAPSRSARKSSGVAETKYSRRKLPHLERPWAKYMVTFSTRERRQLSPSERDLVLNSILYADEHRQYQLYAACVMPDHVHLLFEPQIKEQDKEGKPMFWSLSEILQGIKSTCAHNINKASGKKEHIWEKESMDRMIRGQSDIEEKFHYICRNPWDAGVVPQTENYPWLWTPEGGDRAEDAVGGAPTAAREGACAPQQSDQIQLDIAFRVIADHIRTLGFAIADGIQPGNNDRNYVLRRILRRAVRYGRTLGFHEPFFFKLVDVLADTMGDVFPEIRARKKHVQEVIQREEEAFNKTLDKGIILFDEAVSSQEMCVTVLPKVKPLFLKIREAAASMPDAFEIAYKRIGTIKLQAEQLCNLTANLKTSDAFPFGRDLSNGVSLFEAIFDMLVNQDLQPDQFNVVIGRLRIPFDDINRAIESIEGLEPRRLSSQTVFNLYDTYGFPLDLTELMARERGWTVDVNGFNELLDEQRARARSAQKKEVISLSQIETTTPTKFVGYENLVVQAKVLEVVSLKDKTAVILDTSACYAEMGGQVGDTGELEHGSQLWRVTNTTKSGNTWLHFIRDAGTAEEIVNRKSQIVNSSDIPALGANVTLTVDKSRRNAIERHHTVTHLLHWALHEVVSKEASQKGSFVGPDKLTFDFNSAPLTPQQVADVEKLVNERIVENAGVSWMEVPYAEREITQGRDAILRRKIRRHRSRRPDWRPGRGVEWLFDGTLRRHTHARDRRNRFVPHRWRKRDCRRCPAHRSHCRPGSLPQGHGRIGTHQVARGQGEFTRARTGKED